MPRKLILLLLCLGCIFLGFLSATPETELTFQEIKPGMSRTAVEKILGPPGDYTNGRYIVMFAISDPEWEEWTTSKWCFMVRFDQDDKVIETRRMPVSRRPSWWDNLRWSW